MQPLNRTFVFGFLSACFVLGVVHLSFSHGTRTYIVQTASGVVQTVQSMNPLNCESRKIKTFLIDNYPVRGPMPWEVINQELRDAFTLGGTVPVSDWMLNGLRPDDKYTPGEVIDYKTAGAEISWSNEYIDKLIGEVARGSPQGTYGEEAAQDLTAAVMANPVKDKKVLVIGSVNPWVEAIVLHFGAAEVVTVDFNKPKCNYPRVRTLSVSELDAEDTLYDAVFTFSSLEHDGLGRYGDPLHPNGDIERVKKARDLIKMGGLFFIAVPNGKDHLSWNAHRIYGRKRFPLLFGEFGWKKLGVYRTDKYDWSAVWDTESRGENQPVHVYEKSNGPNIGSHV